MSFYNQVPVLQGIKKKKSRVKLRNSSQSLLFVRRGGLTPLCGSGVSLLQTSFLSLESGTLFLNSRFSKSKRKISFRFWVWEVVTFWFYWFFFPQKFHFWKELWKCALWSVPSILRPAPRSWTRPWSGRHWRHRPTHTDRLSVTCFVDRNCGLCGPENSRKLRPGSVS